MNASPDSQSTPGGDPPVASRPDPSRVRRRALRDFRAGPRVRRQRLPRQARSRPARFRIGQIGAAEACRHRGARRRLATGARGSGSENDRCGGKVGHAGPRSLGASRSRTSRLRWRLPCRHGRPHRQLRLRRARRRRPPRHCPAPRAGLRLRRSRCARPLRPRCRKPRPHHPPRRRRARRRRRRRHPARQGTPRLSLSRQARPLGQRRRAAGDRSRGSSLAGSARAPGPAGTRRAAGGLFFFFFFFFFFFGGGRAGGGERYGGGGRADRPSLTGDAVASRAHLIGFGDGRTGGARAPGPGGGRTPSDSHAPSGAGTSRAGGDRSRASRRCANWRGTECRGRSCHAWDL